MATPPPSRSTPHVDDGRLKFDDPSTPSGFCAKYFSVKSCLLLAVVTVLLLALPVLLPPLPPPPTLLLVVPVALLAMLLLLALAPPCRRNDAVDPAFYL
jgi:hypothetical protein